MLKCCVFNCSSSNYNKLPGITFHRHVKGGITKKKKNNLFPPPSPLVATVKELIMNNQCISCLRDVDNAYHLSPKLRNFYDTLVHKVSKIKMESTYIFCFICGHVLKKFFKFTQQCVQAQEFLTNIQENALNSLFTQPTIYYNMTFGETEVHYYYPKEVKEEDIEYDDRLTGDHHSTYQSGDEHNDDNLPLVWLKTDTTLMNTEDVLIENKYEINSLIQSESDLASVNVEKPKVKKKKSKLKKKTKKLKEGFSSRMVQETDEYIVIKLTKEQVLEEMATKSKTEQYLRYPYRCELCVKGFNFADVLKNHSECHNEKRGPLKCELCSQYCPNNVSMRGHMKSHTTRYKCKVCGIVRPARQHLLDHYYSTHLAGSLGGSYSCSHCQYTTCKRSMIQSHVAKTHRQADGHTCELCGKIYLTKESFRVHMLRHENKKLKCPECPRTFAYNSTLHKHLMTVHTGSQYYCVECDKKFKSEASLHSHFKRSNKHKDVNIKHNCPQCPEQFRSVAAIDAHLTKTHGAPKRHSCHLCQNKYTTRLALNSHIRNKHDPATANYTCDICSKTFPLRFLLVRHMRAHTQDKPHVCACGAAYAQAHRLNQHVAAKHKKENITEDHLKTEQEDVILYNNDSLLDK